MGKRLHSKLLREVFHSPEIIVDIHSVVFGTPNSSTTSSKAPNPSLIHNPPKYNDGICPYHCGLLPGGIWRSTLSRAYAIAGTSAPAGACTGFTDNVNGHSGSTNYKGLFDDTRVQNRGMVCQHLPHYSITPSRSVAQFPARSRAKDLRRGLWGGSVNKYQISFTNYLQIVYGLNGFSS